MAGKTGLSVLSQNFAAENPLSVTGLFTGKNRNVKTNSKAFSKAIQPQLVKSHVEIPGSFHRVISSDGSILLIMRRAHGKRK